MTNWLPLWILFGLGASLALGAANIPQKIALGELSPFAYGILAGLVIILVNLGALYYYGESFNFAAKKEWGMALVAALLFALGSIFIAMGYRHGANASQFVALFNTNTLVATVLGFIILKEFANVVIWKVVLGAIFVVIGGTLLI
jgi:uncharacterized membrane protein